MTNLDDTLDSRKLLERLEELQNEREALVDELTEAEKALEEFQGEVRNWSNLAGSANDAKAEIAKWDSDNGQELKSLQALNKYGEENISEWRSGALLIRETHWATYAKQEIYDLGEMPKLPSYIVIDWDKTADNFQYGYSSVEWDDVTYYYKD